MERLGKLREGTWEVKRTPEKFTIGMDRYEIVDTIEVEVSI